MCTLPLICDSSMGLAALELGVQRSLKGRFQVCRDLVCYVWSQGLQVWYPGELGSGVWVAGAQGVGLATGHASSQHEASLILQVPVYGVLKCRDQLQERGGTTWEVSLAYGCY